MNDRIYQIDFDGVKVRYRFRYPWTHLQFGEYYIDVSDRDYIIEISEELLEKKRQIFDPKASDHFIEYRLLVEPTGTYLASYQRFFFHAVALLWREKAWLFTGPSGAGKTTQFLNWKKIWPDEVEIICGDMPLLSVHNDIIYVNPSPWNGSERYGYGSTLSAPLGGVIDLVQSPVDQIQPIEMKKKIRPFWNRFIGKPDTEDDIHSRELFLNKMLSSVPVWTLKNTGSDYSARLTRNTIEEYLMKADN